ncbi:MAG TPA: glycosyltransferase family 4 protein [Patescibacteria group bacterium]|nr:glycosyltransferase family 4 protein [Patescibacteria group bacterium]
MSADREPALCGMRRNKVRVLLVPTHPTQYSAPAFRLLARDPRLEIQVAYCSLQGARAGFDPEFGREVQWDIPLLDGYPWVEVPNRSPWPGLGRFWGLLNPGSWKLIRRGHFDAVIFYTGYRYATFWIGLLAAKVTGTEVLFGTDAATLEPRDGRAWKRRVKRLLWPLLFRLPDHVISVSAAGAELMRSLGVPAERVTVAPFAVDNDWWSAQAARVDRQAVRRAWNIAEDDLVVLFCAKLQSWKRPLDVLRAFHLAGIPRSVLVMAGEGPLRGQIEAEAAALGIGGRVRVLGFVNQSQLPGTYSAADLFVLPSDYDPCPVVVCEAMLCGLPVVLSDRVPGRFDLVRPGVTGEIFPCGNVSALAEVLRKLLDDRTRLALMSQNAQERIASCSMQQGVAETIRAICRAVVHRRGWDGPDAEPPL